MHYFDYDAIVPVDYWTVLLYSVDMHVARALWPSSNGKTYESIYLREHFRQDGKVKKRDIANLTHCDPAEIAAIELALQHKGDRSEEHTSELQSPCNLVC